MRIFVQSRSGDSFDRTISHAAEILPTAKVPSARAGNTINERAVVLIDPDDSPSSYPFGVTPPHPPRLADHLSLLSSLLSADSGHCV